MSLRGLTRVLAPPPFEIWQIDLSVALDADRLATLDAREQARAARFVFDRDRDRYRAAHVALRHVLGTQVGCAPGALRFSEGAFGKPALADPAGTMWAFNLSHSHDVAWVAMARTATDAAAEGLGVDIEVLRPMDDAAALAQRLYTAAEQADWHRRPSAERDRAFLQCWTRKEACLKAVGSGLSIAPQTFDAGVGPARRRVVVPTPQGPVSVDVQTVPTPAGLVGAIAACVGDGAAPSWPAFGPVPATPSSLAPSTDAPPPFLR